MTRDLYHHGVEGRPRRGARLSWIWFWLAVFLVPAAHALGLGPIEVRSALNQPLDAVIPLTRVRPDERESLTVQLAPLETFRQLGLEVSPALRQLRFKVKDDEQGRPYIHVTTLGPVKEPFLSFVIALEWPKGRLLREYTVLLDPPLFDEEAPPPAAPEPLPPLAEGEPQRPAAPPPAEEGAETTSPAAEALDENPPGESGAQAPFTYGPVRPGETLSTIAQRVHPPEVTLEQMMIALYQANPEAFYGNINLLKAGSVLRLDEDPRSAAARLDPDSARAEVMRQYRAWRSARGQGEPALVGAEGGATAPAPESGQGRLELVAPEEGSEVGSGGVGDELRQRIEDLERRLALANEAAAAAQKENEHLSQRVSALEEQVAALQRLVALRDEQLARLGAAGPQEAVAPSGQPQALAVGAGEASPPPPAPTVAPVTQPSLWQDPLILATLVGGGGLLLLGGWYLWYRRRAQEADEEWTQTLLGGDGEGAAESGADTLEKAAGGDEGIPSVPSVPEESSATPTVQPASDMAASGEIDPLAEADVYMAYGSYDQARAVIDEALEKAPGRLDLLRKRLEIAHQERDVDAFCRYAEAVLEALDGDTDRPEWQQVKVMGEDLVPDHPWFREHTQLMETALDEALAAKDETPPAEPDVVENPDEVTLFAEDTRPGEAGEAAAHDGDEAQAAAPEGAPGAQEGDADMRLAPLEDEPAPTGSSVVEEESRADSPAEDGGALETPEASVEPPPHLDLVPLQEAHETSPAEVGEATVEAPSGSSLEARTDDASTEDHPQSDADGHHEAPSDSDLALVEEKGEGMPSERAEEEFDGNAFFVFTDEVGTKLDLARAYIEMGDREGARELLEEVMDVGDEQQRAEAQSLLRHIA